MLLFVYKGTVTMKLIINADDYGYTPNISKGIRFGMANGVITSTTVLTNIPNIEDDCKLLLELDNIGIGLHLNLTLDKPLTNGKSLVDKYGFFLDRKQIDFSKIDKVEVEFELRTQLEKFIQLFNRLPSHLDSHHSIHDHPSILPITEKLMNEYNIPARRISNIKFVGSFFGPNATKNYFMELMQVNKEEEIIEMMCHPGINDLLLEKKSSYSFQRQLELETLCDLGIKQFLIENSIELTNYGNC